MSPRLNRFQRHRLKLNSNGLGRWSLLTLLVVWFGIIGLLIANRQNILDWWHLRNYNAPTTIAQLASQDTMTTYARKVFYVNRPAVDAKPDFGKACPNNGGEQTIVLGCYHSDQAGIFLLGVTDTRLNGVEQVTAAHEMLHAAYDRLSSGERQKVDSMLMDYYNNGLHDQRILSTISAYKKTEPNAVVNEMHSVFGTEVANLPAGLETYYKRYFDNRAQIAGYAARYQAEFTSRQVTVSQDDAQLSSLKSQIDTAEADLKAKLVTINNQQNTLLSLRNDHNLAAYNAGVPAYNNLVIAYNNEIQSVQSLIGQYNQLVSSRNAIALEEDQLVNELSTSSVTPISR